MLPTLAEFIASATDFPHNGYVRLTGMRLYVRIGPRYINGARLSRVLDIANVEVIQKGRGNFTDLVQRLRRDYPSLSLYVESVIQPRLPRKLLELGFTQILGTDPPCFVLLGEGEEQK